MRVSPQELIVYFNICQATWRCFPLLCSPLTGRQPQFKPLSSLSSPLRAPLSLQEKICPDFKVKRCSKGQQPCSHWAPTRGNVKKNTHTHIYAEAEEHEAEPGSLPGRRKKRKCIGRTAGWSQGPCSLMFDETNLAELGLNLSELRTNGGRSRAGDHQHSAVLSVYRIHLY